MCRSVVQRDPPKEKLRLKDTVRFINLCHFVTRQILQSDRFITLYRFSSNSEVWRCSLALPKRIKQQSNSSPTSTTASLRSQSVRSPKDNMVQFSDRDCGLIRPRVRRSGAIFYITTLSYGMVLNKYLSNCTATRQFCGVGQFQQNLVRVAVRLHLKTSSGHCLCLKVPPEEGY